MANDNIPREAIKSKHSRSGRTVDDIGGCIRGNGTLGRNDAGREIERATGRQIGNCFEQILAHNTIGATGMYGRVCVRVQRTVTPVVRTGPMQKFCYVIIEGSCTQFGHGEGYRNLPCVAKENKDSIM